MHRRTVILCAAATAIAAGCSHSLLRAPLPSYRGPDAAIVYVSRGSGLSMAAYGIHVMLDGHVLGQIGYDDTWKLRLAPGRHTIGTGAGEHPVTLAPGSVTCFLTGFGGVGSAVWMRPAPAAECPPRGKPAAQSKG